MFRYQSIRYIDDVVIVAVFSRGTGTITWTISAMVNRHHQTPGGRLAQGEKLTGEAGRGVGISCN